MTSPEPALSSAAHTQAREESEKNQDAYFRDDRRRLYIVADGMGGYQYGDEGSRLVAEILSTALLDPHPEEALPDADELDEHQLWTKFLSQAMGKANIAICKLVEERQAPIGCTATVALLHRGHLYWAHVGDCRLYLVDSEFGCRLLTRDHRASGGPGNRLERSLGQSLNLACDTGQMELPGGYGLLLCCDGVWEFLDEEKLTATVRDVVREDVARECVRTAFEAGSDDDLTAVYVESRGLRRRKKLVALGERERRVEQAGPGELDPEDLEELVLHYCGVRDSDKADRFMSRYFEEVVRSNRHREEVLDKALDFYEYDRTDEFTSMLRVLWKAKKLPPARLGKLVAIYLEGRETGDDACRAYREAYSQGNAASELRGMLGICLLMSGDIREAEPHLGAGLSKRSELRLELPNLMRKHGGLRGERLGLRLSTVAGLPGIAARIQDLLSDPGLSQDAEFRSEAIRLLEQVARDYPAGSRDRILAGQLVDEIREARESGRLRKRLDTEQVETGRLRVELERKTAELRLVTQRVEGLEEDRNQARLKAESSEERASKAEWECEGFQNRILELRSQLTKTEQECRTLKAKTDDQWSRPLLGQPGAGRGGGWRDRLKAVILAVVAAIVGLLVGFFLGRSSEPPAEAAPDTPDRVANARAFLASDGDYSRAAADVLVSLAQDKDPSVAKRAREALIEHGLESRNSHVQAQAIGVISLLVSKAPSSLLEKLRGLVRAKDTDHEVRQEALGILLEHGRTDVLRGLDPSLLVEGDLWTSTVRLHLVKCLEPGKTEARSAALILRELAESKELGQDAVQVLVEHGLGSPDRQIQKLAIEAISAVPGDIPQSWLEELKALLEKQEPNTELWEAGLDVLFELEGPKALSAVPADARTPWFSELKALARSTGEDAGIRRVALSLLLESQGVDALRELDAALLSEPETWQNVILEYTLRQLNQGRMETVGQVLDILHEAKAFQNCVTAALLVLRRVRSPSDDKARALRRDAAVWLVESEASLGNIRGALGHLEVHYPREPASEWTLKKVHLLKRLDRWKEVVKTVNAYLGGEVGRDVSRHGPRLRIERARAWLMTEDADHLDDARDELDDLQNDRDWGEEAKRLLQDAAERVLIRDIDDQIEELNWEDPGEAPQKLKGMRQEKSYLVDKALVEWIEKKIFESVKELRADVETVMLITGKTVALDEEEADVSTLRKSALQQLREMLSLLGPNRRNGDD